MLIMSVQMQPFFVIIQSSELVRFLGSIAQRFNNSWGSQGDRPSGCALTSCLYRYTSLIWYLILNPMRVYVPFRDMYIYTSFNIYIYIHDVYIYTVYTLHGMGLSKLSWPINLDVFHLQFQGSHTSQCSHRPLLPATWRHEGDSGLTGLKLRNKPKNTIFNKTETMILRRKVRILYLVWMAENLPQVDGWFITICKGKWCLSQRWSRILAPAHLGLGCYGFSIMGMFSAIPTTEEKVAYLRDTSKTIFRQRSLAINMKNWKGSIPISWTPSKVYVFNRLTRDSGKTSRISRMFMDF